MNYWSVTNSGLNLVRYNGCKIRLYRQKSTDYAFQWFTEEAINAGKILVPCISSTEKWILTKNRVIVPSFDTQPQQKEKHTKQ